MGKLIVDEYNANVLNAETIEVTNIKSGNANNQINILNDAFINQSSTYHQVQPHHFINNIVKQYDDQTRNFDNTDFQDGKTWDSITNCRPGSTFDITISIPMRNDSTSWGGAYTELLYKIPESAVHNDWISMGNSGHDGVMVNGSETILTYNRRFLLAPHSIAPNRTKYSIQFKFRHRSYDGTLIINGSHDINTTALGGQDYQNTNYEGLTHFWTTLIVIEYANHPGFK